MIDIIRESWAWIGLDPAEVIEVNDFGNLIVRATDGAFWRICPEELSCKRIADDSDKFAMLIKEPAFQADWKMERMVEAARAQLGANTTDRCYCLKLAGVLGGKYEPDNYGTITLEELIRFTGDVAAQIKDVPDGGQVVFKWTFPDSKSEAGRGTNP